jgi:hypothetical protein
MRHHLPSEVFTTVKDLSKEYTERWKDDNQPRKNYLRFSEKELDYIVTCILSERNVQLYKTGKVPLNQTSENILERIRKTRLRNK